MVTGGKLSRIPDLIRRGDLTGIIPYSVRWVRKRIPSRAVRRAHAGKAFDRRFGILTEEDIAASDLNISPTGPRQYFYEPTAPYDFFVMMSWLPPEVVRRSTFVDIGCGPGRVLLLAAEYGFAEIMGIESSADLCLAAKRNLEQYRCSGRGAGNIRVEHLDVCEYTISDRDCVFFLYNPFGESTMGQFVGMLERSLSKHPRDVFVIYHNPNWRKIWDASPLFSRFASNIWSPDWYLIYRSVDAAGARRIPRDGTGDGFHS